MGLGGSGGRHLPQLHNNPNVELAAIVQRSEQPTAAAYLHTELESKTQLKERCGGVSLETLTLTLNLNLTLTLRPGVSRSPNDNPYP